MRHERTCLCALKNWSVLDSFFFKHRKKLFLFFEKKRFRVFTFFPEDFKRRKEQIFVMQFFDVGKAIYRRKKKLISFLTGNYTKI